MIVWGLVIAIAVVMITSWLVAWSATMMMARANRMMSELLSAWDNNVGGIHQEAAVSDRAIDMLDTEYMTPQQAAQVAGHALPPLTGPEAAHLRMDRIEQRLARIEARLHELSAMQQSETGTL